MSHAIYVYPNGEAVLNDRWYRCAFGRSGISREKMEGDGATPEGAFPLRRVWYRADRVSEPETLLETRALTPHDGWNINPHSEEYNTYRSCPDGNGSLWRDDHVFNILVQIGYNDSPAVAGKGSAIFMHLARPAYTSTSGCVVLAESDLREVLLRADSDTRLYINGP